MAKQQVTWQLDSDVIEAINKEAKATSTPKQVVANEKLKKAYKFKK